MCGTFCGVCQVYQNAESLGQSGKDIYIINFWKFESFYDNIIRRPLLPIRHGFALRSRHDAQTGGQGEIQH